MPTYDYGYRNTHTTQTPQHLFKYSLSPFLIYLFITSIDCFPDICYLIDT